MTKQTKPLWTVVCQHNSRANGNVQVVDGYDLALREAIKFWKSYDMTYDPATDPTFSDPEGGDVEVAKDADGYVTAIIHEGGDGPCIHINRAH